jgi:hypothetical protein
VRCTPYKQPHSNNSISSYGGLIDRFDIQRTIPTFLCWFLNLRVLVFLPHKTRLSQPVVTADAKSVRSRTSAAKSLARNYSIKVRFAIPSLCPHTRNCSEQRILLPKKKITGRALGKSRVPDVHFRRTVFRQLCRARGPRPWCSVRVAAVAMAKRPKLDLSILRCSWQVAELDLSRC